MNEENKLLEELQDDQKAEDPFSVFEKPLTTVATKPDPSDPDDPEVQPESIKDRRHRKLQERLQAEREANIAMAARLEAISDAHNARTDEAADYLKAVERIYGTDSPEKLEATEILKTALKGAVEDAEARALERFRAEQRDEAEAQSREEARLDSMLEEIEDTYEVDLTSPQAAQLRQRFFARLEKLSPKDNDGNIVEFADHHAIWEDLASQLSKRQETRAKDIASRSLTSSGSSASSSNDDATWKFLRENGW